MCNPHHTSREPLAGHVENGAMSNHASKTAELAAMGLRLRQMRELHGLSQQTLGEIMGVSNTAVQAWETGRNSIDVVALKWAAETLGFSTDYVLLNDIKSLPFDLALAVQQILRSEQASRPTRGRPPRRAPLVRDVPDAARSPDVVRSQSFNEPPASFIAAPRKPRRV